MNQKEIEAAGREEYSLWRQTKDRIKDIKEFMAANATTHIERFDNAVKSGDPASMLNVFGPGGGIAGMTKGAERALSQIKFKDGFDIVSYFKPVKTKEQTAAAVNAVKHRFSNYDSVIPGLPRQDYLGVQEGLYLPLAQGLKQSKMDQTSKWVNEIYVEKMRGLGQQGF